MATLTFDPLTEDAANSPLEVMPGDLIRLLAMSFPAPPLETATSGSIDTEGDLIAARRHQNRTIALTLEVVQGTNLAAFRAAVASVEAKAAKIAQEGGTLQYVNDDGVQFTFDVLASDGYEPVFDVAYEKGATTIQLSLTAKPYARGPEVALSSHSENTLPVLIFTETGIAGDVPALGRLVITEAQGVNQAGMIWGLESRNYRADASAALLIQAEAMTLRSATTASRTGAVGGVARCPLISHPPGSGVYDDPAYITTAVDRVGAFRVFGRVYLPTSNTGTVTTTLMSEPRPVTAGKPDAQSALHASQTIDPGLEGFWVLVDYGIIRRDLTLGQFNLSVYITASSTALSGDAMDIDWLMFVPVDEGSGQMVSDDRPLAAGKTLQVGYDGLITQMSDGSYVPASGYEGDYLFIPPAGPAGRTVRLLVKGVRQAGTTSIAFVDSGIDDISAQLHYTPRYLSIR